MERAVRSHRAGGARREETQLSVPQETGGWKLWCKEKMKCFLAIRGLDGAVERACIASLPLL